jgi:hypothetical protein
LVGNKDDLPGQVPPEDGAKFAESSGGKFFAASAKTGSNVPLAFRQAQLEAIAYCATIGVLPPDAVDLAAAPQAPAGGCC